MFMQAMHCATFRQYFNYYGGFQWLSIVWHGFGLCRFSVSSSIIFCALLLLIFNTHIILILQY